MLKPNFEEADGLGMSQDSMVKICYMELVDCSCTNMTNFRLITSLIINLIFNMII